MAGVHWLMETPAMVDVIVNATALSFVLDTDEMILGRLATHATKYMMENLQDYELFDYTPRADMSDQAILEQYTASEMSWWGDHSFPFLPNRLFWTIGLMAAFVAEYYMHNCKRTEGGGMVSNDMFLPRMPHLDFWAFLEKFFSMKHEPPEEETPFWTMPSCMVGGSC